MRSPVGSRSDPCKWPTISKASPLQKGATTWAIGAKIRGETKGSLLKTFGKIQRVKRKGQKLLKTSRKKKMFAEDISEDFSDLTLTGFYSVSGYLRNLRGRLLSSERFSEVFTLWVFTLKPFPEREVCESCVWTVPWVHRKLPQSIPPLPNNKTYDRNTNCDCILAVSHNRPFMCNLETVKPKPLYL